MTNSKNTKKALLSSVLAMLVCVAMLIGSTFAWFTDSVSTGKNKIVAGNLDVEMDYAVFNEDGTFKEWKSVEDESLFDKNALWEPGYTQVVYLKISNKGSLSLNYKLSVDVQNEKAGKRYDKEAKREVNFLLSDYLRFGTVATEAENFFADRAAARAAIGENAGKLKSYSATGSIKASEKDTDVDYVALVVYMPETVGNEANHYKTFAPEITLGIDLLATQMVDENDSFGNTYDEDAFQADTAFEGVEDENVKEFTVSSEKDLLKLADLVFNGNTFEGKTITLDGDIVLASENWKPIGTIAAPFKGTFNGNKHTISNLSMTKATNGVAGLFGYVTGTIQDLTVSGNIVLDSISEQYGGNSPTIGGICGVVGDDAKIQTCTNKVNIEIKDTCTVDGLMVCVGGIAASGGTIENCLNLGNIRIAESDALDVVAGGISAICGWGSNYSYVVNAGTISGPYVGEIVAACYHGKDGIGWYTTASTDYSGLNPEIWDTTTTPPTLK